MSILLPVFIPLICACGILITGRKYPAYNKVWAGAGAVGALLGVIALFLTPFSMFYLNWCESIITFSLSAGGFDKAALAALTVFAVLIYVYSLKSDIEHERWFFFSFLFTLAFACGAVLADNLVLMLFFWEGLLISLYVFIVINKNGQSTAFKAFMINAVGDILLLAGIILTGYAAKTFDSNAIVLAPISMQTGLGMGAFLLIMLGALSKAGAVPFHSWIPDAAANTNVPMMALLPASFEKVLAVFLMGKAATMFNVSVLPNGADFLVVAGIISILPAAFLILKETDLKKFIAYNIILQIGLLAFEHGATMGGNVMELLNHGIYKAAALACLFLCAGAVEEAAGTTDTNKLGGLFKDMKIVAVSFIIASAALCKVTFLDIFFSSNYNGLNQHHIGFIIFMAVINLLVLFSFVRVIINVFFVKGTVGFTRPHFTKTIIPAVFAFVVFLYSIGWVLDENNLFNLAHAHFSFTWISGLSFVVIIMAGGLFFAGFKKRGLRYAADIVNNAPVIKQINNFNSSALSDFYENIKKAATFISKALFKTDRIMDFIIDDIPSTVSKGFSKAGSALHTGYSFSYIIWAVIGGLVFAIISISGGWM